jgi:hypothetical protein
MYSTLVHQFYPASILVRSREFNLIRYWINLEMKLKRYFVINSKFVSLIYRRTVERTSKFFHVFGSGIEVKQRGQDFRANKHKR